MLLSACVYSKGLKRVEDPRPLEPFGTIRLGFTMLSVNGVSRGLSGRPLDPFGTQL